WWDAMRAVARLPSMSKFTNADTHVQHPLLLIRPHGQKMADGRANHVRVDRARLDDRLAPEAPFAQEVQLAVARAADDPEFLAVAPVGVDAVIREAVLPDFDRLDHGRLAADEE